MQLDGNDNMRTRKDFAIEEIQESEECAGETIFAVRYEDTNEAAKLKREEKEKQRKEREDKVMAKAEDTKEATRPKKEEKGKQREESENKEHTETERRDESESNEESNNNDNKEANEREENKEKALKEEEVNERMPQEQCSASPASKNGNAETKEAQESEQYTKRQHFFGILPSKRSLSTLKPDKTSKTSNDIDLLEDLSEGISSSATSEEPHQSYNKQADTEGRDESKPNEDSNYNDNVEAIGKYENNEKTYKEVTHAKGEEVNDDLPQNQFSASPASTNGNVEMNATNESEQCKKRRHFFGTLPSKLAPSKSKSDKISKPSNDIDRLENLSEGISNSTTLKEPHRSDNKQAETEGRDKSQPKEDSNYKDTVKANKSYENNERTYKEVERAKREEVNVNMSKSDKLSKTSYDIDHLEHLSEKISDSTTHKEPHQGDNKQAETEGRDESKPTEDSNYSDNVEANERDDHNEKTCKEIKHAKGEEVDDNIPPEQFSAYAISKNVSVETKETQESEQCKKRQRFFGKLPSKRAPSKLKSNKLSKTSNDIDHLESLSEGISSSATNEEPHRSDNKQAEKEGRKESKRSEDSNYNHNVEAIEKHENKEKTCKEVTHAKGEEVNDNMPQEQFSASPASKNVSVETKETQESKQCTKRQHFFRMLPSKRSSSTSKPDKLSKTSNDIDLLEDLSEGISSSATNEEPHQSYNKQADTEGRDESKLNEDSNYNDNVEAIEKYENNEKTYKEVKHSKGGEVNDNMPQDQFSAPPASKNGKVEMNATKESEQCKKRRRFFGIRPSKRAPSKSKSKMLSKTSNDIDVLEDSSERISISVTNKEARQSDASVVFSTTERSMRSVWSTMRDKKKLQKFIGLRPTSSRRSRPYYNDDIWDEGRCEENFSFKKVTQQPERMYSKTSKSKSDKLGKTSNDIDLEDSSDRKKRISISITNKEARQSDASVGFSISGRSVKSIWSTMKEKKKLQNFIGLRPTSKRRSRPNHTDIWDQGSWEEDFSFEENPPQQPERMYSTGSSSVGELQRMSKNQRPQRFGSTKASKRVPKLPDGPPNQIEIQLREANELKMKTPSLNVLTLCSEEFESWVKTLSTSNEDQDIRTRINRMTRFLLPEECTQPNMPGWSEWLDQNVFQFMDICDDTPSIDDDSDDDSSRMTASSCSDLDAPITQLPYDTTTPSFEGDNSVISDQSENDDVSANKAKVERQQAAEFSEVTPLDANLRTHGHEPMIATPPPPPPPVMSHSFPY